MAYDLNRLQIAPLPEIEKTLANGGTLNTEELSALMLNIITRLNGLVEAMENLLKCSEATHSLAETTAQEVRHMEPAVTALALLQMRAGIKSGEMPQDLVARAAAALAKR